MSTKIKEKVVIEINYGIDNFCYLCDEYGDRVIDIVDLMKDFDGKSVIIQVKEIKPLPKKKHKVPKEVSFKTKEGRIVTFKSKR